jgi:hypothetical protein
MSKVETSGTVHFTVEGEFITDIARSLWNLEGQPERALRILKTLMLGKEPMSDADCISIVTGKAKLTGDSDAGIAIEADGTYEGKTLEQLVVKLKDERDEAIDEREDLAQLASGDTMIVPSHTGAREIPRRKARRTGLSESIGRGLVDGYAFDDAPEEVVEQVRVGLDAGRPKPTKKQRIYRRKDEFGSTLGTKPGRAAKSAKEAERIVEMSEEEKRKREDEEEKQREKEWEEKRQRAKADLVASDTITTDTGWLSPTGQFYPCGYSQHGHVAWALGFCDHPQMHGVKPPGWIRMGMNGSLGQYIHEDHDSPDPPTKVQKDLVRAFCNERSIDEPWWLKDDDAEK